MPLTPPAYAVTLSVRDDPPNDRAKYTVSGTSGGAWTLFRGLLTTATQRTIAWAVAATGTGDVADQNLAGSGHYYWQLAVGDGGTGVISDWSNLLYRPISDAAACPHEQIVVAAAEAIRLMNFEGITSVKIVEQIYPRRLQIDGDLPMMAVAAYPNEIPMGKLNSRDDVGYPVLVAMLDSGGYDDISKRGRWLKWRHQLASGLRNQRLLGAELVYTTEWQPSGIVDPRALQSNTMVGAEVFVFKHRGTRGLVP